MRNEPESDVFGDHELAVDIDSLLYCALYFHILTAYI